MNQALLIAPVALPRTVRTVRLALPWRSIQAFGVPLVLYALTLAPTVEAMDSAELTVAAVTGGIPRATGYPLYLMLGRAWSALPLGDAGLRMNLFSAVCGAGTVLVVERILRRLHVGGWAACAALGLLATSTFFWALSLVAEVYTLHALLMALLILLLLRWEERPTPARLAAAALCFGLSLGHHVATVLLAPGVAWFVLAVGGRRVLAPRTLLPVLAALAVGLSVYLYLPYRYLQAPAFNYAGTYDATGAFQPLDLRQPAALWWLVSGRAFSGAMFAYGPAELLGELRDFAVHLWRAVFVVGVGPGLLGAALLLARDRRRGGMLLLMFACHAAFYIGYRVVDKETMFLPTYVVWALWLGLGVDGLLRWLREDHSPATRRLGVPLVQATLLGAVGLSLIVNWGQVDRSGDRSARQQGEATLARLAPGARLVGSWSTVPVVEYLQHVEGRRPDVRAINRFLIPQPALMALVHAEVGRRPVYLDAVPIELASAYTVRRVGSVYQLLPREPALPAQPNPDQALRPGPLGGPGLHGSAHPGGFDP